MGVITISRGTKSGGILLAESIGERLGAKVLSREGLVDGDEALHAMESELREELVQRPPYLYDTLDSLRNAYMCTLRARLVEQAAEGPIVYHGHGAQILLRDLPGLLRIRVTAPMSTRLQFVMERRGGTKLEASRYIYEKDEARVKWTQFLYGVDSLTDPLYFDLVLNLQFMSIDQATDIVETAAMMPPFRWDDTHPKEIADMRTATRVKSTLLRDVNLRMLEPEVHAKDGVVTIYTDPETDILSSELIRVASSVVGVEDVRVILGSAPDTNKPNS